MKKIISKTKKKSKKPEEQLNNNQSDKNNKINERIRSMKIKISINKNDKIVLLHQRFKTTIKVRKE